LIYDKCIKTEEIFNFLGFVLFAYREIKGEKRKERKKERKLLLILVFRELF